MMNSESLLVEVERAAQRYADALSDLKAAALRARAAGIPQRNTATAAQVARGTLIKWTREATAEQPPLIGRKSRRTQIH